MLPGQWAYLDYSIACKLGRSVDTLTEGLFLASQSQATLPILAKGYPHSPVKIRRGHDQLSFSDHRRGSRTLGSTSPESPISGSWRLRHVWDVESRTTVTSLDHGDLMSGDCKEGQTIISYHHDDRYYIQRLDSSSAPSYAKEVEMVGRRILDK